MHKNNFISSVRGKILSAAVLACFALLMAWITSRDAFKAVLNAFENVSAPNQKLRLVNDLSRRTTHLYQVQNARELRNPSKYLSFLNETKTLNLEIDTLKNLYSGDVAQINRLNTLKKLLQDRDKLFVDYLNVREGLINNKSFEQQVQSLNEIVNNSARQADSTATTTEKKTQTTTIFPTDSTTVEKEEQRSFFNKLFGRRKPKKPETTASKSYQIVNEELKVKRDTVAMAIQDSLVKVLGQTMQDMEKTQQRKSALFVNREAVLVRSNDNVIGQIVAILKKVEAEVVAQAATNSKVARDVVNSSIRRIGLIMGAFVLLAILLLYFIMTDISRINRYRRELELARDEAEYHAMAKQRFLSNMSHEIRTPLQSIIGYAEMVRQQEHPQQKDLEAIYRSSGHLMQIVNEVLDYNRIVSGKFTFASQVFDLRELLDEVISVMQLQAEAKLLLLRTDFDATVKGFVEGDPFRLKQILYNLIGNAIKFTANGEVSLTVRGTPGDGVIRYNFNITDTGTGLSPDDLGKIFKEFEQAGGEGKNRAGTGLGLPITKELIEGQGGSITVKSKIGSGSSFVFELPLTQAAQPVVTTEQVTPMNATDKAAKVWMIDDDPFILELCSRMFDNHGIEYRCFTSPHEVLNAAWDNDVKYLLLDIRMPEMSGITLCGLLRKQAPPDVLIYALTAQAMPGEREAVLKTGFNGLLMKPFREDELIALVGGTINKKAGPAINIKAIEKMTFGDHEQTAKILASFAADSLNDIAGLKKGIKDEDIKTISLLAHRIAGRTAQVGARELATGFRLAEMELDKGGTLTDEGIKHILTLTDQLDMLAKAAREFSVKQPAA